MSDVLKFRSPEATIGKVLDDLHDRAQKPIDTLEQARIRERGKYEMIPGTSLKLNLITSFGPQNGTEQSTVVLDSRSRPLLAAGTHTPPSESQANPREVRGWENNEAAATYTLIRLHGSNLVTCSFGTNAEHPLRGLSEIDMHDRLDALDPEAAGRLAIVTGGLLRIIAAVELGARDIAQPAAAALSEVAA